MKGRDVAPSAWAIVLAGGDGTRLQELTRKIDGDSRPKQFSKIYGDRTLLGHTRERLRPIFGESRLMFVVTKKHARFYTEELADVDPSDLLQQPANRGTGIAIITALLQRLDHEVDPMVGIFPSDHYYADNVAFAATVRAAISASSEYDSIVLIGAKPAWPEIEFGWIEPGVSVRNRAGRPLFGVRRFCEKPPLTRARTLMRNGGLWNTFVTIGRASAFVKLLRATVLPVMTSIADAVTRGDLDTIYKDIETIDFSKHVLTLGADGLLVMADNASGWADLGNHSRVIDTLDRNNVEPDWLRNMRTAKITARGDMQVHLGQEDACGVVQHAVTV